MSMVFVLDDDVIIRHALARQLRSFGLKVLEFATAEEVISRLEENPSLLISDYYLPGADGLVVAAAAKAWPAPIKVLILTGVQGSAPLQDALVQGKIDGLLLKPWHSEELLDALRAALGSTAV